MSRLTLTSSTKLFVAIILLSLITKHQSAAFVPSILRLDVSGSLSFLKATPGIQDDSDGFDNDAEFYRDLRRAKNQKLGRPIPPEQARESAVQAEGDFLQAMRESKDEFQRAKEELGSDGAVDLFLERIREEDERQDEES
uniref:Uncharacterized protein n=1 Tax=Corethron hystrix TaxID=216773 RepID=A0A7S1FQ09_9STRA|mmetsp:Transcript_221/g.490  ORF Transcript_221/g.490 Transcript_221/m.490 type:complete len:140 (+) Transcript_221:166-585(+)